MSASNRPVLSDIFPSPWAREWGQDKFGLFMVLELKGVQQCFRWIRPGSFMMGSTAESDLERDDDEQQHQVTLRPGYWLADSACSQALWLAVTGKNPSHFQDNPNNPVENVSWEDVQAFIQRINQSQPGLLARLPSEAEWEYACRAGTTTAFSFGGNISTEQVNYDGDYPYAGAAKGEYREKTLPVKSLPANPWGLYQMHGNVWEWCQDWYGDYEQAAAIDPAGPPEGSARVVRGGSWVSFGGSVRSAIRYWFTPADRYYYLGFRLALGRSGVSQERQEGRRTAPGLSRRSAAVSPGAVCRVGRNRGKNSHENALFYHTGKMAGTGSANAERFLRATPGDGLCCFPSAGCFRVFRG